MISIHELNHKETNQSPTDDDTLENTLMKEKNKKRMRFWQFVVVITCFITYGLNYFTRNHVYVTTNKFKKYLDPNNDSNAQKWLGMMYTVGQIGFFVSKLICSFLIDTKINSGVKPLAFGLIGVPICTTIIALFNIKDYTFRILFVLIMYTLTKACQAPQWSGVIKILSDWIDYRYYGRVVSFMSLSYLAGDALTRAIFAYVLTFNKMNHWQPIFYFASVLTIIAVIPLLILVKDSPINRGLNKPEPNPSNIYSQQNMHMKELKKIKQETDNYHSVEGNIKFKSQTKSYLIKNLSQSKSWILLKPLLPQMMFYFIILF
eukprot:301669_1